ncbi:MAG: ABC transporter substrate-binding protein [Gammaproteobacteria bacterium CG_4_10_14_0_8_um_filter_38_16]|nr:MAG: ABC transporter substrate-binding protein [Gammaproteobacteria bacterium CG_4_10_14_0_8_um_filter_38_16]PJA03860.1 MAG: ABC transporter substrate-binding protein [Gammaproteobacteria bacterium CG_4_10_14_0_2_um_filter_38_22]PJB10833.1 MAG: ABC transporter substrate-binding protein [Gammaproteobacteria bacterium CG_4_9_14_3_um_filter_38_9]
MYKKIIIFLLALSCTFLLSSCDSKTKKDKQKSEQIIVAKEQTPVRNLYFSGTLSPIDTTAVIAQVAGNITKMKFSYGERVQKGEILFALSSPQLAEDYHKAIKDFLTKKESYINGKSSFAGAEALYRAGAKSKNDYISAKTQYDNSVLDYLQSEYALHRVLQTANVDPKTIESLTIANTNRVNLLLERRFRQIDIVAPASGIALFPLKSEKSSDGDTSGKLMVGSTVKQSQLLLSIGDLSGLSAKFQASEEDIDRLHQGMKVRVTGSAFPGIVLNGFISSVSAQASANSSESSGGGTYAISVKIPTVTVKTMEKIRVGMSAKFKISIKSAPQIMLPIQAISHNGDTTQVTVVDADGKQKTVSIVTGQTTPTDIVILSGVKAGDKIVMPKQSDE